jgi:hypothetical protein
MVQKNFTTKAEILSIIKIKAGMGEHHALCVCVRARACVCVCIQDAQRLKQLSRLSENCLPFGGHLNLENPIFFLEWAEQYRHADV